MKRLLLIIGFMWACSCAFAARSDTLYISVSQTVHLRFASELKYVNLGSKEILAKIVDGSKDFVAVRARAPFDFCTSLSCLESNGQMHTFLVAYREHPERLEVDTRTSAQMGTSPALQYGSAPIPGVGTGGYHPKDSSFFLSSYSPAEGLPSATFTLEGLARRPQELYHIGVRDYGISLLCENIYVKDDILILVLSLENTSAVSYEIAPPRFAVESRKRTRRGLQYEKAIVPRLAYGLGTVPPGNEGRMSFAFDKLALIRGQVLRIYFYEKRGVRNMVLTLSEKELMKAKAL